VVPPKVEYALTPLGTSLLDAIAPLVAWTRTNRPAIAAARADYDSAATSSS
jgi:DNA-binding HxlR family transcriptional regulator